MPHLPSISELTRRLQVGVLWGHYFGGRFDDHATGIVLAPVNRPEIKPNSRRARHWVLTIPDPDLSGMPAVFDLGPDISSWRGLESDLALSILEQMGRA